MLDLRDVDVDPVVAPLQDSGDPIIQPLPVPRRHSRILHTLDLNHKVRFGGHEMGSPPDTTEGFGQQRNPCGPRLAIPGRVWSWQESAKWLGTPRLRTALKTRDGLRADFDVVLHNDRRLSLGPHLLEECQVGEVRSSDVGVESLGSMQVEGFNGAGVEFDEGT